MTLLLFLVCSFSLINGLLANELTSPKPFPTINQISTSEKRFSPHLVQLPLDSNFVEKTTQLSFESTPTNSSSTATTSSYSSNIPLSSIQVNFSEILPILSDEQLEQTLAFLRQNYAQPQAVSEKSLRRALLEGLFNRLQNGIRIFQSGESANIPDSESFPFLAEILDGKIGYLRLSKISREDLNQTDAVLNQFVEKNIRCLIFDLRSVGYCSDFETAAEFARRFAPPGAVLFRIEKPSTKQERIFASSQAPLFSGKIILLQDAQTSGAAEALAACLREVVSALLLGETTAGIPVEFASLPLGENILLQVANAEVVLPSGQRPFPTGVEPDLEIEQPSREIKNQLRKAASQGIAALVFEKERSRFNEAALVANTNPELDEEQISKFNAPLLDRTLQRAVDIATALLLLPQ